jgi:hypothetical protein
MSRSVVARRRPKRKRAVAHAAEAKQIGQQLRAWQRSVLDSLTGADYR